MTTPSLEPCADFNPVLWRLFCNITSRDGTSARHWTEQDVYSWARDWIIRGRISELTLQTNAMKADFGLPREKEQTP